MNVVSSIAIPARGLRRVRPGGKRPTYPWRAMQIGDSFFVKGGSITNISSAAVFYGRSHGTLYTCRSTPTGVRVWRIK